MSGKNIVVGRQLMEQRIKNALKRKRVLTDKQREEKAKSRGGFDTSDLTKTVLKDIEDNNKHCYWCMQDSLKIDADETHRTGTIKMICETPGCPNNTDTKKVDIMPHMQKRYGRFVDGKLCHDFGRLLLCRDPGRLAITSKGIIL